MSIISDLKNLGKDAFGLFILCLISLIIPGALLIFYFWQGFFLSLDIGKLILLSITFTTPLVVINTFIILIISHDSEEVTFESLSIASLATSLIFYLALFVTYLLKLSFRVTIFELLSLEIIVVIIFLYLLHKNKVQNKK